MLQVPPFFRLTSSLPGKRNWACNHHNFHQLSTDCMFPKHPNNFLFLYRFLNYTPMTTVLSSSLSCTPQSREISSSCRLEYQRTLRWMRMRMCLFWCVCHCFTTISYSSWHIFSLSFIFHILLFI